MKKTSPFVKIITLISFVILLSGFVSYRAGLLDTFIKSEPTEEELLMEELDMMGSSKSDAMFDEDLIQFSSEPTDSPPPEPEEPEIRVMPSSKSGGVFNPDLFGSDSTEEESEEPKPIMGGSKSFQIFDAEDQPLNAAPNQSQEQRSNANEAPEEPKIMPSSKLIVPLIEGPEIEEKKNKDK